MRLILLRSRTSIEVGEKPHLLCKDQGNVGLSGVRYAVEGNGPFTVVRRVLNWQTDIDEQRIVGRLVSEAAAEAEARRLSLGAGQ